MTTLVELIEGLSHPAVGEGLHAVGDQELISIYAALLRRLMELRDGDTQPEGVEG